MIRSLHPIVCLAAGLLMLGAQAQTIDSLKVEPALATVGQPVQLTAQFVVNSSINCKVRMHYGDGNFTDFMVNQTKDVPLVLEHSYTKAGRYTARVEGRGAARCLGEASHVTVDVQNKAAVTKPVAASTSGAVASNTATDTVCPTAWRISKAGVDKNTGAFTCTAKANTPIKNPRINCPGDLTYFENAKKGVLGCRV